MIEEYNGLATGSDIQVKAFGYPWEFNDTIKAYSYSDTGITLLNNPNMRFERVVYSGPRAEVIEKLSAAEIIVGGINGSEFGYRSMGLAGIAGINPQNSNSVAGTILRSMGIDVPGFRGNAIGYGRDLVDLEGVLDDILNRQECFLPSTPIPLPDGRTVPISSVRESDEVLAFDPSAENGRGGLVPRRVTAVHRSEVDHVLDVFGLGVTPGHATLCGDGPNEGRFRPVMDILIDDGAVVNENGSLRRLSTNAPVGSDDDLPVQVALVRPFAGRDAKGRERRSLKAVELGWLRTGTRFIKPDSAKDREAAGDGTTAAIGDEFTLGEVIRANGWQLVTKGRKRGMIRQRPGDSPKPFPWGGDALPRPEDYVLAKSGVTLDELRQAAKGPGAGIEPWRGGTGEPTRRPLDASNVPVRAPARSDEE